MHNRRLIYGYAAFVCSLAVTPVLANTTTDLLTRQNVALQITKANGSSQLLFLDADRTYTTSVGTFGTWTINGDDFCVTRDPSSNPDGRGGAKTCGTVLDGKSVGFSWIVPSDVKGDTKYTIINASRK